MRPFREQWKNDLQELKNEFERKRTPAAFQLNGPIRGTWEDSTANGLTRSIIDYLNYLGGRFTRINTMGVPTGVTNGHIKYRPSTTQKGTEDIIGCWNGRYIGIEVKIGSDTQSPDQVRRMNDIRAAGGIYLIAKSFPQFLQSFNHALQLQ